MSGGGLISHERGREPSRMSIADGACQNSCMAKKLTGPVVEEEKRRKEGVRRAKKELYKRDREINMGLVRAVVALLDGESANQTAQLLGLSHSTISEDLAELSGLFAGIVRKATRGEGDDRLARWEATEKGRLIAPALRQMTQAYERLLEQLERDRQILRIGFIRPMRRLVQVALEKQTLSDETGRPFFIRLFDLTSEEQAPLLYSGGLDVVVAYALPPLEQFAWHDGQVAPQNARFFARHLYDKQPYDLVVPKKLVFEGKVKHEQLTELCYVALPAQRLHDFRVAVDQWLASKDIRPADTVERVQASTIVTYAGSGRGFGFLPRFFRDEYSDEAEFVSVAGLPQEGAIKAYVRLEHRDVLRGLLDELHAGALLSPHARV
jgi:DNA-binding transcriptional LysR family regulator